MSSRDRGIFLFLLLAGCAAPAPSPVRPDPRVTRTPEECSALVERVLAHPDSFTPEPPQARRISIPPIEGVPQGWRGRKVKATLLVDARGKVVADSTRLEPALPAGRYDRDFRASLARMEFVPAVLEGCAVAGRSTVEVTLPSTTPPR